MISWFCRFATCSVASSLWPPISIRTSSMCVMGPISLKFPSARYISRSLSATFVVIWCLSHDLLSIKSSVAPESMIALMLTLSYLLSKLTFLIAWSLSFSHNFVLLSAAKKFRTMMGFRSGRLLRPSFTGSLRLFPTLLLPHYLLPLPFHEFWFVCFTSCLFVRFQCFIRRYYLLRPLGSCILGSCVLSWRISGTI